MRNNHLVSTEFRFSEPKIPSWVIEAFDKIGSEYTYIAKFFKEFSDEFTPDIVYEIETAFQGTQNTANAWFVITAHEQRILFMMHAIKYADIYRPIRSEIESPIDRNENGSDSSVNRARAKDYFQMQIQLKNQISTTAKSLASLLRQHNSCSNNLGMDWIECDPLTLSLTADNNLPTHENAKLRNAYDLALSKMDIVLYPELFIASVLDRVEKIASAPSSTLISVKCHLGLGSRKTNFHFIDSFTIWISENCEAAGRHMPDNFHLTNKCWAALSTCLLGQVFNEQDIAMFWNREHKRNNLD